MAPVPTAEEAFGSSPAPIAGGVPTADEAFGGLPDPAFAKTDQAIQTSVYNILNSFGYGAKEGFGSEPIATPTTALAPETVETMRKAGVFNDYAKGQHDFTKGMFEGLIRTGAAGLELANRIGIAAASAPLQAVGQTLEEVGIANKGELTGTEGLRGAVTDPGLMMLAGPEVAGFAALANARRAANLEVDLSRARASGVVGEGEAGYYEAVPVSPENLKQREVAAQEAGTTVPPPSPAPNIHELARRIEPEVFQKLDALKVERETAPEAETADPETTRNLVSTAEDAYRQAQDMLPETTATEVAAEEVPAEPTGREGLEDILPPEEPAGTLKTVEGTGETKTRSLAEGVEANAVEKGITDNFGDLPEYQAVSMADQAEKAVAYMDKDYEGAKAVALGQKQPPKGVFPESVFVAVEKRALAEGDVETLRNLATNSKLSTEATTMGQRIRTLRERDDESPVGAIQEIQQAREASLGDVKAAKVETTKAIKNEMRKASSGHADWEAFIKTITCK